MQKTGLKCQSVDYVLVCWWSYKVCLDDDEL